MVLNISSLNLFYRYYSGTCSSEVTGMVLVGSPLAISIDCMIFLSLFLDVIKISISAISSRTQPNSKIPCLWKLSFNL